MNGNLTYLNDFLLKSEANNRGFAQYKIEQFCLNITETITANIDTANNKRNYIKGISIGSNEFWIITGFKAVAYIDKEYPYANVTVTQLAGQSRTYTDFSIHPKVVTIPSNNGVLVESSTCTQFPVSGKISINYFMPLNNPPYWNTSFLWPVFGLFMYGYRVTKVS